GGVELAESEPEDIHVKASFHTFPSSGAVAYHHEAMVVRGLCTRADHGHPIQPALGPLPPLRLRIERLGTYLGGAFLAAVELIRRRLLLDIATVDADLAPRHGATALMSSARVCSPGLQRG